jgi:hypothetical protein
MGVTVPRRFPGDNTKSHCLAGVCDGIRLQSWVGWTGADDGDGKTQIKEFA